MKAILVRLAITGICLFSFARVASGNVIYDVVVSYEGNYRYSFAMEFGDTAVANAISSNSALEEENLVGGDFRDEAFEGPDGQWTSNTFDSPSPNLSFLPATDGLQFLSVDSFTNATGITAFNFSHEYFDGLAANQTGFSPVWTGTQITLRPATAVPAAPTAALVIVGLVALGARVRARASA